MQSPQDCVLWGGWEKLGWVSAKSSTGSGRDQRELLLICSVSFKFSFCSISNSCFSFCYDTIWRPDFTEVANVTKPILGKFLSCSLACFLLLTGETANLEKEKTIASWPMLESWKNNFSGMEVLGLGPYNCKGKEEYRIYFICGQKGWWKYAELDCLF